jgi:hypothetical protein
MIEYASVDVLELSDKEHRYVLALAMSGDFYIFVRNPNILAGAVRFPDF